VEGPAVFAILTGAVCIVIFHKIPREHTTGDSPVITAEIPTLSFPKNGKDEGGAPVL